MECNQVVIWQTAIERVVIFRNNGLYLMFVLGIISYYHTDDKVVVGLFHTPISGL